MWRRRLRVVAWFFSNWLTWSNTCSIIASCRKSSLPPLNCTNISNGERYIVVKGSYQLFVSLPIAADCSDDLWGTDSSSNCHFRQERINGWHGCIVLVASQWDAQCGRRHFQVFY